MNLPIFECRIDENTNNESGIYAISFVDIPATEIDFVALAKQKAKKEYLNKDTKKQILTGVVLQPEQLIYRNDSKRGEHYIKFSADQIEKIAQKMMKTGIALHNTTHQHQSPLKGNYLTELWIIENPDYDKSCALGFSDLPKGTLMCSYKIEDQHYWQTQVMTGNVKGFSLEGFFFQETIQPKSKKLSKNKSMNKKNNKGGNSFLSKMAHLFLDIESVKKNDITNSGVSYLTFVLANEEEVRVDSDGFVTLDNEQMPAGEHQLDDGNIMVVDDQGQFVETKESSDQIEEPKQKTATEALNKTNEKPTEALKQKIAQLEAKLNEITSLAQEANIEVQMLRKKTPSTQPATNLLLNPKHRTKRHEQMAQALSLTIKNRK